MKHNLAYMSPETAMSLMETRVVGDNGKDFTVATPDGGITAVSAASCLVRPAAGDVVLLGRGIDSAYILAVLVRAGKDTALDLPGNVRINAAGGGLTLSAAGEVNLASAMGIGLTAPHLQTDAAQGSVNIGRLRFAGHAVSAVCDTLAVAARAADHTFRRLVQRLGTAFRYVEGHDEVQSASSRQLVDGTLTIQTENTIHLAEQHIKIDAEQVHLG
ncbi:MAG: DUF3540 domain-containing protein [Pseudomonadota bacterium]